jgi:hypothetical protein
VAPGGGRVAQVAGGDRQGQLGRGQRRVGVQRAPQVGDGRVAAALRLQRERAQQVRLGVQRRAGEQPPASRSASA